MSQTSEDKRGPVSGLQGHLHSAPVKPGADVGLLCKGMKSKSFICWGVHPLVLDASKCLKQSDHFSIDHGVLGEVLGTQLGTLCP